AAPSVRRGGARAGHCAHARPLTASFSAELVPESALWGTIVRVTSNPSPAVLVDDLHVRFGEVEAVVGVSFAALPGRSTALLGRNGAGKSTTMRVLAGVVPPTSGRVVVAGIDVAEDTLGVKRAVGYCPDVGGLVPRATPW